MTTWDISEPNLLSAKTKNNNGVCAMKDCNNKLSNPPSCGFLGVKVCDECRKSVDSFCQDVQNVMDRAIIDSLKKPSGIK